MSRRHALNEETLGDIDAGSAAYPKKSLRLLALPRGLSKSTAHIGTKLLELRPYRTTLVYDLLPLDYVSNFDLLNGFGNQYSKDFPTQNLRLILMSRGSLQVLT
jgi:hypothetical protein